MIRLSREMQQRFNRLSSERKQLLDSWLNGKPISEQPLAVATQTQIIRYGSCTSADVVFVHPIGGYCFCYASLAEELGQWGGVLCLEHPDAAHPAEVSVRSFAELAQMHREAVVEHFGSIPRVVVGWSLGGALALEMVRQWEEGGGTVDALCMIDSPLPECRGISWLRSILDQNADEGKSLDDDVAYMRRHPEFRRLAREFYNVPEPSETAGQDIIGVYAANAAALARHAFRPVRTSVTYLLAELAGGSETIAEIEQHLRTSCLGSWAATGLQHDHFSIVAAARSIVVQLVRAPNDVNHP